jgi:Replication-relaxation
MAARYLTRTVLSDLESRLTERDYNVMQRLSSLRFVSGAQLTRLCFSDSDDARANARVARRELLRLVRLAVLDRLPRRVGGVRSGSAGFVYCLGLAGQRLAVSRGWQPERRWRRSFSPGLLFLRHALHVAELHTRLVEAERSRRFELLELVAEPSSWRSFDGLGHQRAVLKPDSYVRLGIGAYEHSAFIEVDMATEGSRALERQLRAYVAYHASGQEQTARGVFPRVLWLTPSAERVAVIEACVEREAATNRELFQVAQFAEAIAALASEGE